jgi:hypothetical protein
MVSLHNIYILQLRGLVVLKLPSWPSKHLRATHCGLVTDIAVSLHADITVGLVANIIAVGLLADTTVGLHATHGGLPFFCAFAHATCVCSFP